MTNCCQCGRVGSSSFVIYCDGCYDSESLETQARIDELEAKLTKTCEAYEDKLHKMFLAGASSADKITGLKEQLSRAEDCLSMYANEMNWMQTIDGKYNLGKIWVEQSRGFSITLECGRHAKEYFKQKAEVKGE